MSNKALVLSQAVSSRVSRVEASSIVHAGDINGDHPDFALRRDYFHAPGGAASDLRRVYRQDAAVCGALGQARAPTTAPTAVATSLPLLGDPVAGAILAR